MMFSVQMHSRSKRHVNAQKIDVHATAVATILRPIGRPCANIIPPLSYSPATLFSSPPLPPPNQTKPNPTQAKPSQPNPGQPPTDDRFLYLPFYAPSSSTPLPHSHLLLLSIRPYYSVFPSPYPLFRALSCSSSTLLSRFFFFLSFHGAGDPCRATAEPATGIPFLERGRQGGSFAASFRCTPMAISVHAPRTQDDEEDRLANRGYLSALSIAG